MNTPRTKYEVHAALAGGSQLLPPFNESVAGHPLERRTNRIERVVAAYHGRIDKRGNDGMSIVFETADAAVLAACEMQHRCAALPQVSAQRVALRIGVDQVTLRERSRDGQSADDDIALRLASTDDSIMVSERAYAELNADLRTIVRPAGQTESGITAYQVDWRREIPSAAYGGESFWPTNYASNQLSPYLRLSYGMKTLELTVENPLITIGRDPTCDLVLTGMHVSRMHCRIERKIDRLVLVDRSTNGTCVTNDEGKTRLVKNESVALYGRGLLFFGRPFNGERRGGARFEAL